MKIKRQTIICSFVVLLLSISTTVWGKDFILSQQFVQPEIEKESIIKFFPSRFVAIRRTETIPQIDGKLDEDCWKNAASVTDFVILGSPIGELMERQTTVYLTYDDKNIYIGFICEEPNLDSIAKFSLWGEGIEVFLDTNHDHKTYYQVGVTPGGKTGQTRGVGVPWDGEWDVQTSFGDKRWFAEIAIPFESMGTGYPSPGTVWGLNLCRSHTGPIIYGSYPPLPGRGGFHAPAYFANMYFSGKEGFPYIKSISFKNKPWLGINKATIKIKNEMDKKGKFILESKTRNTFGRYSAPHSVKVALQKGQKKEIDISYEIEKLGVDTEIIMTLLSSDLKREYYKVKYSLIVPNSIVELSLDGDTYFLEEKTMSVFLRINVSGNILKNACLNLQLKRKKDGRIISAGEIKDLKFPYNIDLVINIADLSAGEYIILAELIDKNGKVLGSKNVFFRKVEGVEW